MVLGGLGPELTYLQRRYSDGQQMPEQRLNITVREVHIKGPLPLSAVTVFRQSLQITGLV